MGGCKDIEPWWAHFVWRRRIRHKRTGPVSQNRYLGNCYEALANHGTFVTCCRPCHASKNWRDVHTEDGWYQVCCAIESACKRAQRKKLTPAPKV